MASSLSGEYDAEVEWLGSDGYAFFDTGVSGGNDNLEITIYFQTSSHVNYAPIYGNFIDENHNTTRLITGGASGNFIANFNQKPGGGNTLFVSDLYVIHKVVSSHKSLIVDENRVTPRTSTGTANLDNIAIFQRSVNNPAYGRNIDLKIISAQIRDNGTLIRDYIPVRKGSTGYMYDKVNGTLSKNIGSTPFTFGRDKEQSSIYDGGADYIVLYNTAYIDTGVSGDNDNLEITADIKYTNFINYAQLFGNYKGEDYNVWRLILSTSNNGNLLFNVNNKTSSALKGLQIPINSRHTITLTKNAYILDGESTSIDNVVSGLPNDNTFHVGVHDIMTQYYSDKLYFYSFNIKDGVTQVINLHPKRIGYDGCMYDDIQGSIYRIAISSSSNYIRCGFL